MIDHENKTVEQRAKEYGRKIANPVIRSMYPSKSRGEMADEFAYAFATGYNSRNEEINKLKEQLNVQEKLLHEMHGKLLDKDCPEVKLNLEIYTLKLKCEAYEKELNNLKAKETAKRINGELRTYDGQIDKLEQKSLGTGVTWVLNELLKMQTAHDYNTNEAISMTRELLEEEAIKLGLVEKYKK